MFLKFQYHITVIFEAYLTLLFVFDGSLQHFENKDLSIPQWGVLTNGINWIIKDFKTNKWLIRIPKRSVLKRRGNIKSYLLIRIKFFFNNYYQSNKFVKRILPMPLKEKLKEILDLFEFNLR